MSNTNVENPEPLESAAASETASGAQSHGEASHWSDQALQRLGQARSLGFIAIVIGAALFLIGEGQSVTISNLVSSSGLTLLMAGLLVIVAVTYTHRITPDRSFGPRPITSPRMWFVMMWGAGIAVTVLLLSTSPADLVEQLLMLTLATLLMLAGSVWVLRWLSGQRAKLWPINSEFLPKWMPLWTVIWAGVWGAVSTFPAIVIEATPTLTLAVLGGTAFREVPQTRLSPYEGLERAMNRPELLILVFAGAVIGAPLVEEAVKALGLRGLRRWIQRPADGWLLGFAVGLGFGILEGAFSLDSALGWFLGGWERLVALLLHGLATSLTGLGYARYLQTQQRSELWRGYRGAVIMHGLWNASVLIIVYLGFALSLGAIAISPFLICLALPIIIGLVIFMVLLIRRVAQAGVQSSIQEDYQQAGVPLPGGWSPMPFNLGWRLIGRHPIFVPVTVTASAQTSAPIPPAPPTGDSFAQRVEEDSKSK